MTVKHGKKEVCIVEGCQHRPKDGQAMCDSHMRVMTRMDEVSIERKPSANAYQVDGSHYQRHKTQHWDWAQHKCYLVGAATKYLDRHDAYTDARKTGVIAIRKALHYIQKLVERDYPDYELVFEVRQKGGNVEND